MREVLSRLMHQRGLGRNAEHTAVFAAWGRIVPDTIAQRTRPVSFRAGRLIVAVSSAPLLEELRLFRASEFLQLLNRELSASDGPHALVRTVEFRRA
jgi:predicted nucleic acid-binding Zn ribbon protein